MTARPAVVDLGLEAYEAELVAAIIARHVSARHVVFDEIETSRTGPNFWKLGVVSALLRTRAQHLIDMRRSALRVTTHSEAAIVPLCRAQKAPIADIAAPAVDAVLGQSLGADTLQTAGPRARL